MITIARSLVARRGVSLASPLAVVVSAYLFFAGHNQPGGGFAAGLVLGALLALRSLVGLSYPTRPRLLLGAGVLVAGATAVIPIMAGRELLDQVVVEVTVPVLGTIKSGSALVFDAGVTLVVVGLIVAVIEGLGASQPPVVAGSEQ